MYRPQGLATVNDNTLNLYNINRVCDNERSKCNQRWEFCTT